MTNDLIWDFENNYPETDIESNELKVKITDSFINEMSVNREVSALGFCAEMDGDCIVCIT